MLRTTILALPALAALVVAYALLVVGPSRPSRFARVSGGPTVDVAVLALRVEAAERLGEVERPLADTELRVEVVAGGEHVVRATTDARGVAEIRVPVPREATASGVAIAVYEPRVPRALVRGTAALDVRAWRSRERVHGRWTVAEGPADAGVRVAPARGALPSDLWEPLLVEVERVATPRELTLVGAGVELRPLRGASPVLGEVVRPGLDLRLSAPGPVVAIVEARATGFGGEVCATSGETRWCAELAPVRASVVARREGEVIVLQSAVPRDVVHADVIDEGGRLGGATVALSGVADGTFVGRVSLRALAPEVLGREAPAWIVASAEPSLDSQSTLGWPVQPAAVVAGGTAPRGVVVPPVALLDGAAFALARDADRRKGANRAAALFVLFAMGLEVSLILLHVRLKHRELGEHLARAGESAAGAAALAGRHSVGLYVVVALLCVGLGFAVIGLLAVVQG
ncbi:MAG: hypothetical protein IT376_23410 [Polyangiaceae bacterium]|nr:hypothetical protein [Polyangiaceae bacterium]